MAAAPGPGPAGDAVAVPLQGGPPLRLPRDRLSGGDVTAPDGATGVNRLDAEPGTQSRGTGPPCPRGGGGTVGSGPRDPPAAQLRRPVLRGGELPARHRGGGRPTAPRSGPDPADPPAGPGNLTEQRR